MKKITFSIFIVALLATMATQWFINKNEDKIGTLIAMTPDYFCLKFENEPQTLHLKRDSSYHHKIIDIYNTRNDGVVMVSFENDTYDEIVEVWTEGGIADKDNIVHYEPRGYTVK